MFSSKSGREVMPSLFMVHNGCGGVFVQQLNTMFVLITIHIIAVIFI